MASNEDEDDGTSSRTTFVKQRKRQAAVPSDEDSIDKRSRKVSPPSQKTPSSSETDHEPNRPGAPEREDSPNSTAWPFEKITTIDESNNEHYPWLPRMKSGAERLGEPDLDELRQTLGQRLVGLEQRLEQQDYDQYIAMFKGCTEKYQHVRVVFTGKEGVGKTTLCLRLQGKSLRERIPTEGAVLYPAWFFVDWNSKTWGHSDGQRPSDVINARMGAVWRTMPEKEASLQTGHQESSAAVASHSSENPLSNKHQVITESKAVQRASRAPSCDKVLVSLWDMGGHQSFQASHNVFISSHGVYILVFNLTEFLLEIDRLKKWIRLIGTFSSDKLNSKRLKLHDPPLIFVGTFLDQLKKTSTDYKRDIKTISESISHFPELSAHHFVRFCTIDNTLDDDDQTELEELRGLIIEAAVHQDQWERKLPTKWLKLDMDLIKAREDGKKILTLAEVMEINKTSVAPLTGEAEMKLALEFLHCTRSVIYFREFDHIVIDPQWLADFFSVLITDDQFLPTNDLLLTRDIELYKTQGEMTQKLIDGLVRLKKNADFLPHKSVLLALMEKFGLVVRILMSGTTEKDARFSQTYTVPSKLKELPHDATVREDIKNLKERNRLVSKTLCFVFKDVYVPGELFHRVFAHIMKTYRAVSLSTQGTTEKDECCKKYTGKPNCLFLGLGCFEVNDLCRMIVSMHAERSTIAVTVISLTESTLPIESGTRVRHSIEGILRDVLLMSNQQHFEYTRQLHCNFHLEPYDTPVDLYGVLHSEKGLPCKGAECQGQHRLYQKDIKFWDITEETAKVQRKGIPKGEKFVPGSEERDNDIPNRRPTARELGRLARLVNGENYTLFFSVLGLEMSEIMTTRQSSSCMETITQFTKMFLKWTKKYPNQTLQHIERAMGKAEMESHRIKEVLEETDEDLQGVIPNEVLDRTPSDAEIQEIVTNIGSSYFNLCLELGLSPPAIDQQELNHPSNFQTKMTALLRCWVERFKSEATIGQLLTAMKVCQMDWYTTAEIWLVG